MKKQSEKWAVAFHPNDNTAAPHRQVCFGTWREATTFAAAILNSETTTRIVIVALPQEE